MLPNALKKRNSLNKQFEQGQIASVPTPYFSSFNFEHKCSFPTRSFLWYSLINHLGARKKKKKLFSHCTHSTHGIVRLTSEILIIQFKTTKSAQTFALTLLYGLAQFPGIFLTPDSAQQFCESNAKTS